MNYKERENELKKGKKTYQERLLEEKEAKQEIDLYDPEDDEDDDGDPYGIYSRTY